MYKILIVDDEPRHRRGLIAMVKRLRPAYEIFEAKNGEEGLNFILSNAIDIVITDIKMPIMDGLKMVEKLADRLKSIKVIILSVYDLFEYARKSINLGVFDYVLKPVDENRIRDALERAEDKIKSEQKAQNEKQELLASLSKTLPVYMHYQLNKWINGELDENEVNEIENIFPYKGRGAVLITEVCKNDFLNSNYNKGQYNDFNTHYL